MSSRAFTVTAAEAGTPLAAVISRRLSLPWSEAQQLVRRQRVYLGGGRCADPTRRVRAGQQVRVHLPPRDGGRPQSRPDKAPALVIRYQDAHVVVVEKPAGLTTMRHPSEAAEFGARAQRFLPPTLADQLSVLLASGRHSSRLRAVHRLDRDTSGLVVFARTAAAESHLGKQFRAHTIERRYLAIVRGRATSQTIESYLIPDRGDGRRGSTPAPGTGKRAVTHVRVLENLGEFTLVECRLETGRTHQVRIHLGEAGTPICGERVYDRPLHGRPVPDTSGAPRLALHAASLGFDHPATGKRLRWSSPLPADLTALVTRLRKRVRQPPGTQVR
jgi:23S rRNA pseudouridine1911/1915/1917 synthase